MFATTPLNVLYSGNFAVCIFFVLSGFVLSIKFFQTKNIQVLRERAIKRYFRLVLPVFTSVVLFFIAFYIFEENAPILHQALYEGLIGSFISHQAHYNVVLWTMTFEFLGSMLVFLFCALFGTIKNRFVFYAVFIYWTWDTYYLGFMLGVLLCDLYYNKLFRADQIRSRLVKLCLLAIAGFIGSYPNQLGKMGNSVPIDDTVYSFFAKLSGADSFYHSIAAFLVLLVLLNSNTLKALFSSKLMIFLGYVSFSMYLTHNLVVFYFSKNIFYNLVDQHSVPYAVSFLITFFISLLFILGLAYLFAKYVDQGSVKFSDYVYKKLFYSDEHSRFLQISDVLGQFKRYCILMVKRPKSLIISICAAVALLFLLYSISPKLILDKDVEIEFTIQNDHDMNLQVYYSTNDAGFAENNSRIVAVAGSQNFHKVVVKLPVSNVTQLRFDFGINPGAVTIAEVKASKNGSFIDIDLRSQDQLMLNQIQSFEVKGQEVVIYSELSDPYIVPSIGEGFGQEVASHISYTRMIGIFIVLLFVTLVPQIFVMRKKQLA
ncbi:hypothetical protein PCURB6_39230 [Paenibacillus curdlanolyticus]|nr:hypothetical protein PCURB6_39230 [Paenibacillus curdlanolyticus]